jgi:D-3-phosphoglycerate dehydrogenase
MPQVLSTHPLHPRAVALIEPAAEFRIAESFEPENLIASARDADIIIVRAPLPPELFEHAPRLRVVIRHGAGLDMIPLEAATRAGVLVANVPGANARSVAEHVIFCAMALARRFRVIDRELRSTGWHAARAHADATHEISGKTLGLIGLGHVGREVHTLAKAFGMAVIAFKPSSANLPAGVALKPLESVITEADFLVLCCPLNNETRGVMNRARLSLMKRTAFLINVARGAVLVEDDVLQALSDGTIAGAALDVFSEQPLAERHPLFAKENVLLSPHLAGITEESMARMGVGVAEEVLLVLKGGLPVNLVNPAALPAYQARFGSNHSGSCAPGREIETPCPCQH